MAVDLMFFAANLTKLVHGAWLPLLIGIVAFTVMTTWQKGREIVTRARDKAEGSLPEFISEIDGQSRRCHDPRDRDLPQPGSQTAPLAMRANVEHNHVLHEHVIIMSIDTSGPRVGTASGSRSTTSETRRRNLLRVGQVRLHGAAERPCGAAAGRPGDDRGADRHRQRLLLPVQTGSRCGPEPTMAPGASGFSSPRPTSPPMPPSTSACRSSGRSSSANGSRSRAVPGPDAGGPVKRERAHPRARSPSAAPPAAAASAGQPGAAERRYSSTSTSGSRR